MTRHGAHGPAPSSPFEDAIDIPLWLEADGATPFAERVRRDREIAQTLPAARTPAQSVRAWWRRISSASAERGPGARLDRVRQFVSLAMFVLGTLAGIGVALAAFQYEGTYPVNVVRLLALLLVVPSLLLLLTLLLIPGRVPGLRGLQDVIASLNPGALGAAVYRKLARPPPDFAGMFGWEPGRSTAASRFSKWQLIFWSQLSAVAFNLAALATGAMTIAFTDLAFGWSTTIAVEPAVVSRIVDTIAWPWHAIAPSAVPSFSLIERSQFFRLEGGNGFDADAPRVLAGWWSFTILAITVYGLLPRIALLALAARRLRRSTNALLTEDSRVTALLDRMVVPEVELGATSPEDTLPDLHPAAIGRPAAMSGNAAAAVIWGGNLRPEAARAYALDKLGLTIDAVVEAGGSRGLEEDRAALASISRSSADTLVIFTPAWEPPLLEFLDFVTALREGLGQRASIVVTPVSETTEAASPLERDTWAQAIGRLADPRLYLETGSA